MNFDDPFNDDFSAVLKKPDPTGVPAPVATTTSPGADPFGDFGDFNISAPAPAPVPNGDVLGGSGLGVAPQSNDLMGGAGIGGGVTAPTTAAPAATMSAAPTTTTALSAGGGSLFGDDPFNSPDPFATNPITTYPSTQINQTVDQTSSFSPTADFSAQQNLSAQQNSYSVPQQQQPLQQSPHLSSNGGVPSGYTSTAMAGANSTLNAVAALSKENSVTDTGSIALLEELVKSAHRQEKLMQRMCEALERASIGGGMNAGANMAGGGMPAGVPSNQSSDQGRVARGHLVQPPGRVSGGKPQQQAMPFGAGIYGSNPPPAQTSGIPPIGAGINYQSTYQTSRPGMNPQQDAMAAANAKRLEEERRRAEELRQRRLEEERRKQAEEEARKAEENRKMEEERQRRAQLEQKTAGLMAGLMTKPAAGSSMFGDDDDLFGAKKKAGNSLFDD